MYSSFQSCNCVAIRKPCCCLIQGCNRIMKPGLIIGQKGVKYGLISRKDDSKKPAAPKPAPGKLAAFGGDSDSDEDNIEAQVARQAARKVADHKVQDMYAAALAEDPNAFEYDALYESMQEQKAAPKQQERLARRPKYIASLLEQAEVRKKEQGITYERMLLKERQKEDHMYDNTEKFITSAYRRKLEEDKKWQESQRLKELDEEQNDVTKLGHMNNFYTNLTKNIAMGGDAAAAPRAKPQVAAAAGAAAAAAGESPPPATGRSQSPGSGYDGEPRQQQEAAAAAEREQQQQQQRGPRPASEDEQQPEQQHRRQRHDSPAPAADRRAAAAVQQQKEGSRQPPEQTEQQQQQAAAAAAAVAGKRKNTEDAIAAARERYLARKRQQQG